MFASLLILAEESANPWGPLFLPVMLVLLGYFILFRPMQRQEKERQAMVSALKKKDRVVTSAGIIGVVEAIKEKEDEVTLKIDENSPVRLKVLKSSIVRVLTDEAAKDKDKEKDKEEA